MPNKTTQIHKVDPGFFEQVAQRAKLTIRLMLDKRVSPWLKLLPVGSLIYLINPIDIPGPFDDIAVVSFGFYMFFELCPPAIVAEHMADIRAGGSPLAGNPTPDGDVVDAEFREVAPGSGASEKANTRD